MLEYEIEPAKAGRRLDVLVSSLYPEFTRSSLEKLFDMDMVSVNGEAEKPSYRVKQSDKVTIDETNLKSEPPKIEMPVIFEDENVIVLNKPAGVLTHSKGALNLEPTVASFVKEKLNDKKLTGNRAGIVHRLDRGTSGVIIAAKNNNSLKWLQKQFSQRKVKKQYCAIAEGLFDTKEALIDAPIGRNPLRPQTFKALSSGKPALTQYKVIKELKKDGKNFSELKIAPLTGRTHQIRVHLAYIGHPVVGDNLYGHDSRQLLLHARSLELTLPDKGRRVFSAPLPGPIEEFLRDG